MRYALIGDGGIIEQMGSCPDDELHLQGGETQLAVPAPFYVLDTSHYLDGLMFRELPPKPGRWAKWDGSAWVDPRTSGDRQAALYAARAVAKADKADLLMALHAIGVLTLEEAVQAAQGQVPASFEAALAALPEAAQGSGRIKWAGDTQISRMHPLIVLAAYARGISDDQIDAVFGVQIPD
jgi:hypothetical protein